MNITQDGKKIISVGFCPPQWQKKAEDFSKSFKAIKDFSYTWRRWKNWENGKFPVVISLGGDIVGLHAATFSERSGYVNSYYQAVHGDMQGKRMGGRMVNFILSVSSNMGLKRLKMKTPLGSAGHAFWRGFGLYPIGYKDEVLYWDVDINFVENIAGLIEFMKHRQLHSPPPEKELKSLLRRGIELLPEDKVIMYKNWDFSK